jgi:hypothetical protein
LQNVPDLHDDAPPFEGLASLGLRDAKPSGLPPGRGQMLRPAPGSGKPDSDAATQRALACRRLKTAQIRRLPGNKPS